MIQIKNMKFNILSNITIKIINFAIILLFISCSFQSNMEDLETEDLESFVGNWEVMKFAYFDNNQLITNETLIPEEKKSANISDYQIEISLEKNNFEFDTTVLLVYWFPALYYYSIDGSSMNFLESKQTSYVYKIYKDEGNDILHALTNTQRYEINGKELKIYFTGLNEKNVLILKKIKL